MHIVNTLISNSEEDTKKIANNLASKLNIGDIIILSRGLRFWENKVYRRFALILEFAR